MFRTEGFQKYLRNVSWLFADRIVRLASVLISSIFITRYLGPELFGQLNYASALVGIFYALTSMGIDDLLTRDLVRNPEQRDTLLGTAALIKLGGSLILLVAVISIALLKDLPSVSVWMVLLIALAELLKPILVIEPWFHSLVRGRVVAQFNIVQSVITLIFKLGLVLFHASLVWFAAGYIVELAALSGGAYIAYRYSGLHVRDWRFDRALAIRLMWQAWPLLAFALALFVQAKIDQVMIGDLLRHSVSQAFADAEVGQYSVALKMVESFGFVPSIVVATLAPALTRARQHSQELYVDRLLNQYRLMFVLWLVTAIPMYILAEPMIVMLFGEEYRAAGWLLSLFSIRLLFTNIGVAKMSFITNEGLFRFSLVMALIGATCNIILNYLLIPPFKSVGAIWAMIISNFISIFLLDLFYGPTRPNFAWMMKGMATFWRFHRVS